MTAKIFVIRMPRVARLSFFCLLSLFARHFFSGVGFRGRIKSVPSLLLPPQNAAGNWIKVIQRVPVRIQLDSKELAEHPLRVGLSMFAKVDTHDRSGPVLRDIKTAQPPRETAVYATDQKQLDSLIEHIIDAQLK